MKVINLAPFTFEQGIGNSLNKPYDTYKERKKKKKRKNFQLK